MKVFLKQIVLIGFITLMLAGVQAVKESPWHDHGHAMADCALCHFEHHEAVVSQNAAPGDYGKIRSIYQATFQPFKALDSVSPYQGRAPPRLS